MTAEEAIGRLIDALDDSAIEYVIVTKLRWAHFANRPKDIMDIRNSSAI